MTSSQPQTTRFFWMATLQKPTDRGLATQTSYGTVEWSGPATRYALLEWFMTRHVPADIPHMMGANILHWQCEPDDYAETQPRRLRSAPVINPA